MSRAAAVATTDNDGSSSQQDSAASTASTTTTTKEDNNKKKQKIIGNDKSTAAMAAALSVALCVINRFLVSAHAGVSALTADTSAVWNRQDDEGVLSVLGSVGGGNKKSRHGTTGTIPTSIIAHVMIHDGPCQYLMPLLRYDHSRQLKQK